MWCVGRITEEYRQRMYALLDLYAKPYNAEEPVVCLDEKSKQLLGNTRTPLLLKPGACLKEDYEYKRAGTRNIFVAVEPKGGHREASVTARRTKADFVTFVLYLLQNFYSGAQKLHLVLDNLNTHFRGSFVAVLGAAAAPILERLEFHYTPKHASWLNMAELEIGIMEKQCTGCRLGTEARLTSEVAAWQLRRNVEKCGIEWTFTRQKADNKLSRHYVPYLTCSRTRLFSEGSGFRRCPGSGRLRVSRVSATPPNAAWRPKQPSLWPPFPSPRTRSSRGPRRSLPGVSP